MTEQPRDPFAPPDSAGSFPPPGFPPPAPPAPAFPPPTGAPLPPPPWSGDPFGAAVPPQPPRRGRGWIIAGAVAGGVVLLGAAGIGAAQMLDGALSSTRAGLSTTGASGDVWISDVVAGDCYVLDADERREAMAGYVTIVDCTEPHDGQVYAVVPVDFDTWPGKREVDDAAEAGCREKDVLLDDAIWDATGLNGNWYLPFEQDWDVEDHTAQCVVEADDALGLKRSWLASDSGTSSESA